MTPLSTASALATSAMADMRSIGTALSGSFTTPIALERADDAAERAIRSLNQLRLMVRTMRRQVAA